MHLLGLTGGYCAGKNEVASILEEAGWQIIDVDKLGHEALPTVANQIFEAFGSMLQRPDGSVDRKKLGEIVFQDKTKLHQLESIVHPAMLGLLDEKIDQAKRRGISRLCINAALLYRFLDRYEVAAIIEVRAPLYIRVSRAITRDHLSFDAAIQRVMQQRYLWALRPQSNPPVYMVWNIDSKAALKCKTLEIVRKLGLD